MSASALVLACADVSNVDELAETEPDAPAIARADQPLTPIEPIELPGECIPVCVDGNCSYGLCGEGGYSTGHVDRAEVQCRARCARVAQSQRKQCLADC